MSHLLNIIKKKCIKDKVTKIDYILRNNTPWIYEHAFLPIKDSVKQKLLKSVCKKNNYNDSIYCWPIPNNGTLNQEKLVSVIVPNYNHGAYLEERLKSIYAQTYKNIEVILLDDCSTDDSADILDRYQRMYPEITRFVPNKVNGKSVFKQWQKGISLANGEYIWIAESDDWCEENFLEEMLKGFSNSLVMLSFSQSKFMRNGICINDTKNYLSDLINFDWQQSFAVSAHELVKYGFARKNVIPNVSSMVFKKHEDLFNEDVIAAWDRLHLCGDWFFYLNIIRGGAVYYSADTLNYYRIHEKSTSLKIQSMPDYYREYEYVSQYVVQNYNVEKTVVKQVYEDLVNHWKYFNNSNTDIDVSVLYNVEKIWRLHDIRKPNILMCGYSFIMGGGETYPIFLANEFRKKGYSVTFINYGLSEDDPVVRELVNKSVPILDLATINYDVVFIRALGADVLHSHHCCVDEMNAIYVKDTSCAQIVTLHGMYEAISPMNAKRVMNMLKNVNAHLVYTAEKNLTAFKKFEIFDVGQFEMVDNGLPDFSVNPISRAVLNISEDAFVFCIVSRGIPEKGWNEAVQAVHNVRKITNKDVQLVIIGDGLMYEKLKNHDSDYIHLVGRKSNIRDYFAMSNMGLLPTYFQGESYPLVLIDCLKAGRPMLSTNIGEISHQLRCENGMYAGMLIDLVDNKVDVTRLTDAMAYVVNNPSEYREMCNNVKSALKKFDIGLITDKYAGFYRDACSTIS